MEMDKLVSSPPSLSSVICWVWRPALSFQNKKLNGATGKTLTPIGLERVFQRITQTVDSSLAAKMSKCPPRVPWSNIAYSLRNHVEGGHVRGKLFCNCRWIPAKDQLFPWVQKLSFVWSMLYICSTILRLTAYSRACHSGQCKVLKLQTFRSVLDQIRSQYCFLLYAQSGEVQEVTDCERVFGGNTATVLVSWGRPAGIVIRRPCTWGWRAKRGPGRWDRRVHKCRRLVRNTRGRHGWTMW